LNIAARVGDGRLGIVGTPQQQLAAVIVSSNSPMVPLTRLDSVDFRVCNGGDPQSGEVPMRLIGDECVAVGDPSKRKPLHEFIGQRVHAVAGIGNPTRFFASLRASGIDVVEHPFPDHHAFAVSDLDFGGAAPVLMTEKDAVKCAVFARPHWWSVPVRVGLPASFFDAIAARIAKPSRHR
jgi:tetraacyldisaccharide 4'-kinase